MSALAAATRMTLDERHSLKTCENVIERGVKTFMEVGTALKRIRDENLYRDGYPTFETYVKKRWDFAKSHAYRLIDAASVCNNLSPIGDKGEPSYQPATESQARPLAKLEPEKQVEVWNEVVEQSKATGEPITAAVVEAKVEEALSEQRCPNCGGTDYDDDGDCRGCFEPAEEAPEPTTEEAMRDSNRRLDEVARKIMATHSDAEAMENPHLNATGRLGILKGQLKSAADVLRVAKGTQLCAKCGETIRKNCKSCHGTGWVDRITADSQK